MNATTGRTAGRRASLALAAAAILSHGGSAWAQSGGAVDTVDRAVSFVERSTEATELFNAGRAREALEIFQDLLAKCPDLDEDGYVAVAVGDCLAELGRNDEARAAYDAAVSARPELGPRIASRLLDVELSGPVTDDLIARLREAAQARDDSRFAAYWRLGRALQSRAKALLAESALALRTASEADSPCPQKGLLLSQAVVLDELVEELAASLEQCSRIWGTVRVPLQMTPGGSDGADALPRPDELRGEWSVRVAGGTRAEVRVRRGPQDGDVQITVNGKPVKLTDMQRRLVRRHQQRISEIVLQAAGWAEPARSPRN